MTSMALYGAALTAASGGAMVAMERALGWSRQLRLTPLQPGGLHPHEGADRAGARRGRHLGGQRRRRWSRAKPSMPTHVWVACAVLTLLCTMVFAALGVFVGYLVPGRERHAGARPRPGAVLLPGQRVHADRPGHARCGTSRRLTPMFGVAEVSRAPLTGDLPWYAVRQRGRLAGGLRRRRRVADEQGHGAGLSGTRERRDP